MHCGERIPFVGEEDLTHLRRIEAKRTPIPKAQKPLPVGLAVRVNGGSFGGMAGVVERSDRGKTLVCFNGRYTVRVATSLLSSSEEHRLAA
jgi:transcription antitermination factor NusG